MTTRKTRARGQAPPRKRAGNPADLAARAADGLPALLPTVRWFGAKSRTVTGARPLDFVPLPGTAALLALFEVAYADGGRAVYQVPAAAGPRGAAEDPLEDPGFCLALLAAIRGGAELAGQAGSFRFVPTPILDQVLPEPPAEVARIRAEQSNTSVVFGQRAILKLLRKLEPGLNPDFEVSDALTRGGSFRGTPRLLGSVTYLPASGEPTTLAVLQEFLPNQGDAWAATLARLAEYYAAALEEQERSTPPGSGFARTLAAADAEEARRLGALTGRLHTALAAAPGAAFAPEPIAAPDVAAWVAGMEAQLSRAVEELTAALPGLPEGAREPAQALAQDARLLLGGPAALQALTAEPVTKIRVHGDYHLGQVLRTAEGFVVLDFEGEPARPLQERREKQCALKDVAGMLRSFAYAAQAALFRAAEDTPEDPRLPARLQPWAEAWEEGVRAGFLEGYLEETWQRGAGFLPRTRETLEALLRAYELDKATYELRYELNSRPAWVRIPLEGLRRALTAPRPEARRVRRAAPFHFVACLELREFVGVRAENERQLADRIEEVPRDSIYYHTHAFFLRHKFMAGAFPNDFATWVAVQVRDRLLGERLAMVDPGRFGSLEALREELASVIHDHLRTLQFDPGVFYGEPFDFVQSRIVEIPTGVEVRTLEEFRDALLSLDLSAIYFHLVEARLRLGRGQNDFAAWLGEGLGLERLAARIQAVDPYASSLERTRAKLIQLCDEALAEEATR